MIVPPVRRGLSTGRGVDHLEYQRGPAEGDAVVFGQVVLDDLLAIDDGAVFGGQVLMKNCNWPFSTSSSFTLACLRETAARR